MSDEKIPINKVILRIRNNPIVALAILAITIVITLSTFTDALSNLLKLVTQEAPIDISGLWSAEVDYPWANRKYQETFSFNISANDVNGTASFLGVNRVVLKGKLTGDNLAFATKTDVIGAEKYLLHRYQGKIVDDEIHFIMYAQGTGSENIPIHFIAKKKR